MTDQTAPAGDNGVSGSAIDPSTATTGTTTANTPSPSSTHAWLGEVDELTLGYAQNKGWQNPNELLASYQNLEKLFGADRAGNTVTLPKEGATPEELSAFYNKLGRPSDPKGYGITLPEGVDPTFSNDAMSKFHELGLSKQQGAELSNWWLQYAGGIDSSNKEAQAATFAADEAALKQSWGQAYDQNLNVARNVAKALELDEKTVDSLQSVLGHKGVMELLTRIGSKSGEDSFVLGDGKAQFGGALTPAQAKAEIAALQQDRDFVAKYLNKDTAALKKMSELHSYAYPE
jgi:hypothetical protein